jgi:ABC-type multidrug transport system permease subunit
MFFHWLILFIYLFILFFCFFETGFLCIAQTVLELTLWTRLASNSEICLPLPALKVCATPLGMKKKILEGIIKVLSRVCGAVLGYGDKH